MSEKQQGLYVFKDGKWQEISSRSEAGDLPIATEEQLGTVKIGKGLDIDKSGILSIRTASKIEAEEGKVNDKYMTPLQTTEHLLANGVQSVAGVKRNESGDVPLTIGDLTTDSYLPPSALPHEYPLGVTMFKTNNTNESNEWKELIPKSAPGSRFLITTYKADERWQSRQVIMEVLGYNTGVTSRFGSVYVRGAMGNWESDRNGWSDLVKLLDNMDLSDSTTSDSSDKVATSKAVYKLQQEISELRNAIIELGGKL